MTAHIATRKTYLRKAIKEILKTITDDSKLNQSKQVVEFLLKKHEKFLNSKHIAVYLAMKHEEIDTIPLIETVLSNSDHFGKKHIYVPHVKMNSKSKSDESDEMVFYELKNLNQFRTEMNDENKYKIKQFNNPESLTPADIKLFDLVIVPGLAFDLVNGPEKNISRLGRGKGYYDSFLSKIPQCYTIGIGFNEQFIPFNDKLIKENLHVPLIESKDVLLNEFLCEKIILKN